MTSHQEKKLDTTALRDFRDRFDLPLTDDDVTNLRFYRPHESSREIGYLKERRVILGGSLPTRRSDSAPLAIPPLAS